MNSSSRFWDRIANHYSRKPVPDEAIYQRKLQVTREYLRAGMKVLEFGCGSGTTAISHAPFVGEIVGIDSSAKMIEIAKQRAAEAGVKGATFEHAGIETYAAADASFDAVLALNVLHLVPAWQMTIRKVFDLLRPGGVFVSSTSCMGGRYLLLRMAAPALQFLGLMPQVRFFTAAELVDTLEAGGFSIEHTWYPGDGRTAFVVARK